MDALIDLFERSFRQTLVSLSHNWPYLLAGIATAALLKTYLKADRVSAFLYRFRGAGVFAATAAAVTTPFCSCGTTAVVLGMMAGSLPLAPIVAFMVASPLSSPGELLYSAGLFGWTFAGWHFGASALLGLAGGGIAAVLEGRGWLKGQTRLPAGGRAEPAAAPCCRAVPSADPKPSFRALSGTRPSFAALSAPRVAAPSVPGGSATAPCGCGAFATAPSRKTAVLPAGIPELLHTATGVARTLVPMFLGFAFLGYLLNGLLPQAWISALFGEGRTYGVPLAATLGLPLYVNSEASLPLVRSFLDSGMSRGAVLAFLIAGSGTSVGAVAGALTIARWRVVGLVAAVLWVGAILAGWGFDLASSAGWI